MGMVCEQLVTSNDKVFQCIYKLGRRSFICFRFNVWLLVKSVNCHNIAAEELKLDY